MLKRYYKLDEAAEFLSAESKHRLSTRDILEIAARGDIRLCFWFQGILSTFEDLGPLREPEFVPPSYTFRGYIQIPESSINPEGEISWFSAAKITDVVQSLDGEPMPETWTCGRYFMGQYDCEPERGCFHVPFLIEINKALIPTTDLLELTQDLKSKPITTGRAHVSNKLAKISQAAARFWGNADRDDRGTHEDNATVAAWLVQQGFSQTLADKAATIIRPEWAPTGRKPEV